MDILLTYLNLWDIISYGLSTVYNVLSMSLVKLFSVDIPIIGSILDLPIVSDIINLIFDTLGIGNYSLLGIMFGVGVPFLVAYTVIKWFISVVT